MSKQSLEEAVKLRNIVAYDLKVSVLSTIGWMGLVWIGLNITPTHSA